MQAQHYPFGMVWDEAELAVARLNQAEANRAQLLRMAVSSILSKKDLKSFKKQISKLTGD